MLEVTFRYTEDDLKALAQHYPFLKRYEALLWTFVYLLLGMAAGSILPALLGFWTALAMCWAGFLCLVLFVLYRLAVQRPESNIDVAQLHPITMRLEQSCWQTSNPFIHTRDDWSKLSRIESTGQHVFVLVEDSNAFVISISAFPAREAAEQFVAFAQERIQSAVAPADRIVPSWQVTEPDLIEDEQAADVVRGWFTPTIDELEQDEFKPPATKEWAKSLAAIFVCIGVVVLVFNGRSFNAAWYMLCAAAGMLSLALAVIASYVQQRRSWRNRLPVQRLQLTQLAASPRGISLLSATHECHINWQAYAALRKTSGLLILEGRPSTDSFAIPRRAFASEQDLARFEALAAVHIQPTAEEAPAPAILPTPETGNPYQPPLQET